MPWTALRNGFYAHSLDWLLGSWRESGVIAVPGEGPVSWTSRAEVAEAAASILLSAGGYDGPVVLTASEAPTFAEIATVASELTGRRIERVVVDGEDWVRDQVAAGSKEFLARFTLGVYQAAHEGYFAEVGPGLRELLGREPATVDEVLAQPAG